MQVVWPASIDTSQGPIEGEVTNISLGGALIQLEELPDVGGALDLSMQIPEKLALTVQWWFITVRAIPRLLYCPNPTRKGGFS